MEEARHTTDNQLNCPICLTTYESPKVLTCLHTFCEKCICKHVQAMRTEGTQSDTIACPVCRSYTPAPVIAQTPDDWAAKLPTNSTVLKLISLGLPGSDDPIYCQPCSKNGTHHVSVAYCVTCSEYHCHTCYNCHKRFKMTSDHTFTVNTLSKNPNASVATESIYRCSSHNKRFTYFCLHHKELCCHICATSVHKPCMELSTIEDIAKDMNKREDPKQISENLEALKELFHILLENNSKCLESIQNQKTEIAKSIQQWKIAMNGHIEKVEADMLHELDQVCKQETIVISDHIAECKSTIAAIETSHRMLNEGNQSVDDVKVFMTTTRISKHAQKYLERYEFIENDSDEVQIEFRCDKTPEEFVRTWTSVGKVKSKKYRHPKLSSSSSFELSSFSAKVPGDATVCDILSGVFLPDEKLVLSDVKNKKLKLFDKNSNSLHQLEMEAQPRYICRVDHRTVAVTAGDSMTLFSVSHTLTRLRTIDVGHECYGIASYQENIIVDKIEEDDELLVTYDASYKPTNKIQLAESSHIRNNHCISPDGKRIYYTTENRIITINTKGVQLNMFKSKDLKVAGGITVDKKGIVYCCGIKSNTVVQVTPEGKQLSVLLPRDCGLISPAGICLNDQNNKILVFEENSDYVKVFRLK